jgi:hypothetical protein
MDEKIKEEETVRAQARVQARAGVEEETKGKEKREEDKKAAQGCLALVVIVISIVVLISSFSSDGSSSKYIYHTQVAEVSDYVIEAMSVINILYQIPFSDWGPEQFKMIDYQLLEIALATQIAEGLNPPKSNEDHYILFINGLRKLTEGMVIARDGIFLKDPEMMLEGAEIIEEANEIMNNAIKFLK